MLKKINIKIKGLHCESCKTLIETEVDILKGVKDIKVNYQTGACQIEFDDQLISLKRIFETIEKLNYKVEEGTSTETLTPKKKNLSKKLILAGVLLVLFLGGYLLIKATGGLEILAKLNEKNLSYGLLFLIGLLVSFHCVGMCGGLVITYTTKHLAQNQGEKKRFFSPHLQYNLGRLISYTVIGGILGGFGSFFGINPTFTGIITLLAAIFMILMGLSLLTNFKWLAKIKLKTPSFIARYLFNDKHSKKPNGPFIIGLLNGFMPCGPLQAMQLYALASGSMLRGALSMGVYALGTIPLMFGFGSFISLISQERIKQIMKVSGIIVMVLGFFMFNRGLTNFGLQFNFLPSISKEQVSKSAYEVTGDIKEYQTVEMDLTYQGYVPNVLYIKKDVPVRWIINVKQMSGCTNAIQIEALGIQKNLQYGENVIEFTPPTGIKEIKFSCGMRMVWGKFVVLDEASAIDQGPQVETIGSSSLPNGSCSSNQQNYGCGCNHAIIK
jgi:sulfite exporter TauE/SafE/copper chaperone CopZ